MDNIWQLYEINDYKKINAMLNSNFKELINTAKKQVKAGEEAILVGRNVKKQMGLFMSLVEGYGASNTEPRATLFSLICEELGLPTNKKTIDQL